MTPEERAEKAIFNSGVSLGDFHARLAKEIAYQIRYAEKAERRKCGNQANEMCKDKGAHAIGAEIIEAFAEQADHEIGKG